MSNRAVCAISSSSFRKLGNLVCLFLVIALAVALSCKSGPAQTNYDATRDQAAPPSNGQPGAPSTAIQPGVPSNSQSDNSSSPNQASPAVMSADQIIDILRQQPDVLAEVKAVAAQQTGVDPGSISNDALFAKIQQDVALRAQMTEELNKRGYHTNVASQANSTEPSQTATSGTQTQHPPTKNLDPGSNLDEPQTVQRPNPYETLPSLRDLYTQIPPAGAKLQRFGSDAFLLGTGNVNELPMDLPVGPDYVLGPGDNIIVNMWGGRSERLSLTIDRQGQIALPEAGTITLDSLTITQAQAAIQKALGTQFQSEHVEISLGRLRSIRIYVVGDVQRPGAYDVSSMSTPLSALYAAGGPTSRGSLRLLRQYRGDRLVRTIDLYDFLLKGVRSDTDRLLPGDTILVPTVGPQVTVEGMVRRPAIYELNGEQHLNQIIDLAGGVQIVANLKQINVERTEANQRRTMLSLDLPDNAADAKAKLAEFPVQDGDHVVISRILPYNQQAVFLQGHVYRPGKYAYREGMTLNDLLHSYQDVMPEPADHVEVIRLQPPDYRPETISLSLPEIMIGNNPLLLKPFDLVRIFGRYEIDSPKVSIAGEVLRPGSYPLSNGMTVAGLVRMAGGFRRSAYQTEADLASYAVLNGQSVEINHKIVDLKEAMQGNKDADTALKPGDVVSVRELSGWKDIGSSVLVAGEVQHAGSFGIEKGERLSSVIRRAGGFRDTAYPAAAVLDRVQVRELGEQARQDMIRRIESTPANFQAGMMSAQDQAALRQSLDTQRQQILTTLRSHPASGRQVVSISSDISQWENTPADIEMRSGDTLIIPKRPSFVMVSGQVYNTIAISFMPGRTLGWYLQKAGGVTKTGDKKAIYVLRADGSVVGRSMGWLNGDIMNVRLRPGDTIEVPEKLIGGSTLWRNILATAQVMSQIGLTGAIAGAY